MTVIVDRKKIGTIYGGTYQYVEVDPGKHKIGVTMEAGEDFEIEEICIDPGQVSFLEARRQIGIWAPRAELAPMGESEGRQSVGAYRMAPRN